MSLVAGGWTDPRSAREECESAYTGAGCSGGGGGGGGGGEGHAVRLSLANTVLWV